MHQPPAIFMRFFRWFCRPELRTYIEGDLVELYNEHRHEKGKRHADFRFAFDVLLLFRPSIIKSFRGLQPVNNPAMIKSYFTIGWRNLLRNKAYSLINIGGLAIGMAIAILIGLWVYDEISYDKNFKNYTRIAQVLQNQTFDGQIETWGSQAMQLGAELRSSYGNYFEHVVIGTFPSGHKLTFNNKTINMTGSFAEPAIADMLTLDMIQGTRTSLNGINGALLSRSAALALFGNEDPINKMIRIDHDFDATVTGIYEDLPENCSFAEYDVLLSWQIIGPDMEQRTGWGNSWFRCLVQLRENVSLSVASEGIRDAKLKRVLVEDDDARFKPALFLHPMSRWRLYSEFENGVYAGGGQIQYVRMMTLIGVFVLFLACINFMNLSTARSEQRAKEVGIRKSIGSLRIQLISQFFSEALLVALLACILSLMMVQLSLPWFNEISGKSLTILWSSSGFWLTCVGFAVVTGLLSGTYPALFLSSFQPIKVLKGTFKVGRGAFMPRKVLVVVQFTVSVTLIVSTVIIFKQIQFAQSRPVGYSINGIVSVPIRDAVVMKHYDVLRDELLKTGVVEEVAASESSITATFTTNSGFTWHGKDPNRTEEFVTTGVTHEFGKTLGWKMKAGRDFSRDIASDSSGFIINEAAAKFLGMKDPLGEIMKWGNNGEWKIIGIVEDMVTQSPYNSVEPMIFFLKSNRIAWIQFNQVNMKLRAANATDAMAKITPIFKKYDPDNAVEYMFADQEFGKKFNEEKRIGKLAMVATILAIVISCLGLFGLASFVAAQRTKEIGIRKILGASVPQLWQLLSKDFLVLVIISCIVSVPFSFYFMSDWLTQYDYRIDISWQIYVAAWLGSIIVTLLTISFQSLKTALGNPVGALRSE